MSKQRLDQLVVSLGLVASRSQAESYIKLGHVKVSGEVVIKPGIMVSNEAQIELTTKQQYVSRAGLKLASVAEALKLDFRDKLVLDVGSSTGGFTDYALRHKAKKVIAVEVGSDQLHSSLHDNPRIELHEKTDIRDFKTDECIEVVVIDVSFISLRQVLPAVSNLVNRQASIVAMAKPQFEAINSDLKHKGVVKNDHIRRNILKDFESWAKQKFVIVDKADSKISGAHGNLERFYLLRKA